MDWYSICYLLLKKDICLSLNTSFVILTNFQVAEVSRILRPGGVFVATTTIADGLFSLVPFRSNFREVNDFSLQDI